MKLYNQSKNIMKKWQKLMGSIEYYVHVQLHTYVLYVRVYSTSCCSLTYSHFLHRIFTLILHLHFHFKEENTSRNY